MFYNWLNEHKNIYLYQIKVQHMLSKQRINHIKMPINKWIGINKFCLSVFVGRTSICSIFVQNVDWFSRWPGRSKRNSTCAARYISRVRIENQNKSYIIIIINSLHNMCTAALANYRKLNWRFFQLFIFYSFN